MANPKNVETPIGWNGLSPRIPQALARPYSKYASKETPSEQRFDFLGPVFRGDAATFMLALVPSIRRLARWPQSMAGGDVVERESR